MFDDELNDERYESAEEKYELDNDKISVIKLGKDGLFVLSRNYMNQNDILYEYLKAVKPIPNFEDFGFHGNPHTLEYETTNGQSIDLTPEEFAEALLNDKEYHGGNIRLLACKSGMLSDGFAQKLANILNVEVIAPTETLWVDENGEMLITNNEILADLWSNGEPIKSTGIWKHFVPQKNK